jgi:hypothetical protein
MRLYCYSRCKEEKRSLPNSRSVVVLVGAIFTALTWTFYNPVLSAPAEQRKITFHFPARSVGKIEYVELLDGRLDYDFKGAPRPMPAMGTVQIPAEQLISFTLNYDGAANASFLDSPEIGASNLLSLDMHNVESANDETLKHITHLTKLRRLLFSGTDVSDAGLKYLAPLKHLTQITGSGTLIKGPGLVYLEGLNELGKLEISRSNFKGFNFDKLPVFKSLHYLSLSQSVVDDTVCTFVGKLPEIRSVDISRNKITDAGIAQLVGAKKLAQLNLCDTQITPKCLPSLAKLPALAEVKILLGQLPPDSEKAIEKRLPKCHFELRAADSKIDSSLFSPLH